MYYGWDELKVGDCHQTDGGVEASPFIQMEKQNLKPRFGPTTPFSGISGTPLFRLTRMMDDGDDGTFLFNVPLVSFPSPKTHGAPVHMEGGFPFPKSQYDSLPHNPAMVRQTSQC